MGWPRRWLRTGFCLSACAGCRVCRGDRRTAAPGELPGHLRSLGGSSKDCMARCHAEHQWVEARQANIGRMPMVRVKLIDYGLRGLAFFVATRFHLVGTDRGFCKLETCSHRSCPACFAAHHQIAWHDAMLSTSGRRPAKRTSAGCRCSRKDRCRVCRKSVRWRRRKRFQVGTHDR